MGRLADRLKRLHVPLFPRVVAAGLLFASGAGAAFEPGDEGWEGCSQLVALAREELGTDRVRPITGLDYSMLEPGDAVLFLHPVNDIRFPPVAAFLAAGGRVAVVDDYGSGASLLRRFHIERTSAPARAAQVLRDNSALAIALPPLSEGLLGAPSAHRTLRGVEQVVTNHPTALRLEPGVELTSLLTIPAHGQPDALLAVTGVIGNAAECGLAEGTESQLAGAHCGRLVAMGDPSVFINLMLKFPGNRKFARGLVQYLVEDDVWGTRSGNLYILAGRFTQIGDVAGGDSFSESVDSAQAALVEWLIEVGDEGLPEPLSIALAAVLALGVVIWAGLVGGQGYGRTVPAYCRPTPLVAQGGQAGRFAVLASPSADRGLIVLELKRSLEDNLRERLGLPEGVAWPQLLGSVHSRGLLSPAALGTLKELFQRLSGGEVAVMSARRLSVSDRVLRDLHSSLVAVVAEIQEHEGEVRDGSSKY